MNKRTKEFIVDNISRIAQIVFAVLIIGPFVTGFSPVPFVFGVTFYGALLFLGMFFTKSITEEE